MSLEKTHCCLAKTKTCQFVAECYSLYKLWNVVCPETMFLTLNNVTQTS